MKGKFEKYDLVKIRDLSETGNSHFPHSQLAIVLGSYADEFGGNDHDSWELFLEFDGEVSWYDTEDLTLVEHGRKDILDKWRKAMDDRVSRDSDIDYIFEHGKEIVDEKKFNGTMAEALFKCLTNQDIWGSHGEGFVFMANAMRTYELVKPYLEKNDKEGWLKFAEKFKRS